MKKAKAERTDDDMLPEYDFTGQKGVRGKYYRAYREGHTVRVHQPDGSVVVQHFAPAVGAVMLEPDVRKYFSISESISRILRWLIALKPARRGSKRAAAKPL